jgi:hypothetical protein
MKPYTILLLLVITTLCTYAQSIIKPGDKIIRYDWIKPSHDFYRNVITDTAGKVKYDFVMEDYTAIDPVKKQITFARYRQVPIGSFSTDTSVTDMQLKPIRMHEIHYQRDVAYDMIFGDVRASIRTIKKGVESVKNYPMKVGYFEDNMIEYIFGYLDLQKGVSYTLDNFNKDTPAPSDPYIIEYAFDDVWDLAAGRQLNCTVLRFTHGGTNGYIWIDKSSHLAVKTIGSFKGGRYVLTKV